MTTAMHSVLRQPDSSKESLLAPVRLWVCTALIFALLALLAPVRSSGDNSSGEAAGPVPDLQELEQAFERVIERVSPSVVGIRVQRRYLATVPGGGETTTQGILSQLVTVNGSGTVIDRRGLILTNEHVIQSANQIEVFFSDGQSLPGTVVAADARSDLAVLKTAREDLPAAGLADWSEVARGQWTITLGNPYGLGSSDGKLSVSVGVISNLGRRLPGLGEVDDRFYSDMIQTTAAIHPGCSGGPLFNIQGELVGVVTAMHTRAPADEGVGFAIPMNPARRRLIKELSAGRPIMYGYLGVDVRAVEPVERQAIGIGPQRGAVVQRVDPDGPAGGEAGLREGDLILRFNQEPVRGPSALAEMVGLTQPGTEVAVELQRGEQHLAVRATLQRRDVSRVSWMRGGAVLWRGMRVTDLTPQVRRQMSINGGTGGVAVIDVAPDSPAQRAAIQIGDVIEGVAAALVDSTTEFQQQVRGQPGPVKIRVRGRGELVVSP